MCSCTQQQQNILPNKQASSQQLYQVTQQSMVGAPSSKIRKCCASCPNEGLELSDREVISVNGDYGILISTTRLHRAIYKEHIPMSMTPLHWAIYQGHILCVKALLEREPESVNAKTELGRSPLFDAIFWNRSEIVQLLLEQPNIDPNAGYDDRIPLLLAIRKSDWGVVQLLLEHPSINPNIHAGVCKTLWKAAADGDLVIKKMHFLTIQTLLENSDMDHAIRKYYGDSQDEMCIKLLQDAVEVDNWELIQVLLKYDIEANFEEYFENEPFKLMTPLCYAVRCGYWKSVHVLLNHGHMDLDDEVNGIEYEYEDKDTDYVEYKYKSRYDNFEGRIGVLHIAAIYGHEKVMQVLLENSDINPNQTIGYYDFDDDLPNTDDFWVDTALHFAALYDRVEVVKVLLNHKDIDIDIKNQSGHTALDIALKKGSTRVADELFSHILKKKNIPQYILQREIGNTSKKK
ncbi:ankyrin repeat domain-containing protein [Candidatus Cardinium hertigii]|nr:ankyrin repeat domain-containing protein [Candidatus Cardinium hertigii]